MPAESRSTPCRRTHRNAASAIGGRNKFEVQKPIRTSRLLRLSRDSGTKYEGRKGLQPDPAFSPQRKEMRRGCPQITADRIFTRVLRLRPGDREVSWKRRPDHHFDTAEIADNWNAQHVGTAAFTTLEDGYFRSQVRYDGRRCRLRAARVAFFLMTGLEPAMVDHENLVGNDDRFVNLRAAEPKSNSQNRAGERQHIWPKGVAREGRKFAAAGHIGQRKIRLGKFNTSGEAHAAYCAWAKERHGEFFNPGSKGVFD